MKASEIRIGSLIQLYRKAEDKEMSTHTVCGIENTPDIGWMVEIEDGFYINVDKGIEPIPLTEEWLLKFGFENHKHCFKEYWQLNDFQLEIHGNKFVFRVDGGESAPYLTQFFAHHTKYVHQLQNLVFALTGEELTIK